MELPTKVIIGDTGPVWAVGHYDDENEQWRTLDGNYSCSMAVPGSSISRAIVLKSDDSKYFVCALTAAETALLERGKIYFASVQINNSTLAPAFAREVQFPIFMTLGGVA